MRATLLPVAFCLLAGCVPAAAVEGPVAQGQTTSVDGPRVRPDRVIQDSRCPADVRCAWEGRLLVRATVFGGGWSKQVDLTLGIPVPVADGMLTLIAATSEHPPASEGAKPPPYRFAFLFQGGL